MWRELQPAALGFGVGFLLIMMSKPSINVLRGGAGDFVEVLL